jgi:hypothetical protein
MSRWLCLLVAVSLCACASSTGGPPSVQDGGAPAADGGAPADAGTGGPCTSVTDCAAGMGCLRGTCQSTGRFACGPSDSPIVLAQPGNLDFGGVQVGNRITRTLTVRNIGSCNLNVREVSIAPGTSSEFTCAQCRPNGTFPIVLIPSDMKTFDVLYLATDAMPDTGSLNLVTDDPTYPLINIPMKSTVKDAPRIYVDPLVLDFGYVPVGQTKTLSFNIKNAGGMTPLEIRAIENNPLTSTNFFVQPAATLPAYVNYQGAPLRVDVTYRPQNLATHNEGVAIASSDATTPRVEVAVKGFSVTPPLISVSPTVLNFGDVPIGHLQMQPVSIQNSGGADLTLQLAFQQLSSSAFSFNPTALGSIAGGGRATLYVQFLPSVLGPAQGILDIQHNAASTGDGGVANPVQITVVGTGTASTGDDVLALEMTFENGDNGFWASDLRDVDMHYRSPYFQDCSKQDPMPNWGTFGTPQWIGIGPHQIPERIIHTNPGMTDGTYAVELLYVEDCSSLPVALIAQLGGVGIDVVISYLSGGAVPPGIGGALANLIANTCFGRSPSNAQVKVYVNGQLVTSKTVQMQSRGDLIKVFDVIRQSGHFTFQ